MNKKQTIKKHPFEQMHPELKFANTLAYKPSNLIIDGYVEESESKEYGASDFKINSLSVKFRAAKTTPKKTGQFVTLWKRIGKGPILPFDLSDPVDFIVVSVRNSKYSGQFIFPKSVLNEKGIISKNKQGGKRAMRVYPPWSIVKNKQAKVTQEWQLLYFLETSSSTDSSRVQKLFFIV